jgi:protocatechuate 3,4-dioxygenase beta subunit
MRNLTEANVTEAVNNQFHAEDKRLQHIITSLTKHLHAFIREVELTEEEWFKGIDFLTRTGQMCDDKRQEFILLSDTLGVSILVDAINHRTSEGMSESTVFGPFWVKGAKELEHGANIARGPELERGEPTVVRVKVTDPKGNPLPNAIVDVWHADDAGNYDVQDAKQPELNLRGVFRSDKNGDVWFKTIKPQAYPIPYDGPVGEMLKATGRHPMRPAHIHFLIEAEGFERLITHIFVEGDQYLESDAVFGVKDSLVTEFKKNESLEEAAKYGFDKPFYEASYTFGLKPEMVKA